MKGAYVTSAIFPEGENRLMLDRGLYAEFYEAERPYRAIGACLCWVIATGRLQALGSSAIVFLAILINAETESLETSLTGKELENLAQVGKTKRKGAIALLEELNIVKVVRGDGRCATRFRVLAPERDGPQGAAQCAPLGAVSGSPSTNSLRLDDKKETRESKLRNRLVDDLKIDAGSASELAAGGRVAPQDVDRLLRKMERYPVGDQAAYLLASLQNLDKERRDRPRGPTFWSEIEPEKEKSNEPPNNAAPGIANFPNAKRRAAGNTRARVGQSWPQRKSLPKL